MPLRVNGGQAYYEPTMRRVILGLWTRAVMAVVLLLAFAPNALFLQHYGMFQERDEPVVKADPHAHHRVGNEVRSTEPIQATSSATHCHVGPESCAASSGLSNAVVISAVLALTLLGGPAILLQTRAQHLALFDLSRRLIVPPRVNLRTV
jgi:hypothetical protein